MRFAGLIDENDGDVVANPSALARRPVPAAKCSVEAGGATGEALDLGIGFEEVQDSQISCALIFSRDREKKC
jgi:hypothetical protein